ncbi:hypothetical protein [Conexibacter arvalis]|uniref:Uncharacterized protein n=1 Tax=Conexibacter arvalis TaxID=912552 RepID=A0A840I8N0_9ACTN|nr:hypothetical protein [Conexibacter arvalis]MBB4661226.1 hypothetical protein [Conexibacter arvalis]
MADRTLCLTWGQVARGREARSLEVFNDAVGYYATLQDEGRIERFDVVLLGPGGGIDGMMLLHGSHDQLDAVKEDERFQRITIDAQLVVDELRVLDGWVNEGVARPMALFLEAASHVPQHAQV